MKMKTPMCMKLIQLLSLRKVFTDDPSEVSKDVKLLSDSGLIDTTVKKRLQKHHKVVYLNGQHQLPFQCSPV